MTNFSYTIPLPVGTNNPSVDRPNMTINNASIAGIIATDHVGFGLNNGGTHSQVTLLTPLGSDPVGLTGSQAELYTKAIGGIAQLFFANSSVVNQLTSASASNANFNSITLPGGLKICYSGILSFSTAGTTYNFPVTYTTAPAVIANCEGSASNFRALSVTSSTTSMTGYSQTSGTNVFVIAIGI